jgi:hypothetical protein
MMGSQRLFGTLVHTLEQRLRRGVVVHAEVKNRETVEDGYRECVFAAVEGLVGVHDTQVQLLGLCVFAQNPVCAH